MHEDGGFTKSWRRKWRNPVFRNLRDGGIWSWLIDMAAWKDTTVRFLDRMVPLTQGQLVTSERFIADGFCCDRQVVRRLLDDLEANQMVTRARTHGGTIITICKYSQYQSLQETENPPPNPSQTQAEPTPNPNKKEVKEVKEVKEEAYASSKKRGSRLQIDFVMPEQWFDDANTARVNAGLPGADLRTEGVKFINYFASLPGQKGIKLDWRKTWLNWALNAKGVPNGQSFANGNHVSEQRRPSGPPPALSPGWETNLGLGRDERH